MRDVLDARTIASRVESETGYKAVSWQEANEDLLSALQIRNFIMYTVVGAILLFALNVNIPYVSDDTLGIILLVAGALTLVLALVLQAQRGRTKHVQETRYDGPPPA